ncbi:MAG TPA: hypothetical protein VNL91_03530 [Thermoanaerobaculia bacterium]|nr:hypothetical protein [Thermoanaerobaculia bacterium]
MRDPNPFRSRSAWRAILAAALFVTATAIPLLALAAACTMPCCTHAAGAQMMAAGCAEQCGIRSDAQPPQPLAGAVTTSSPAPQPAAPLDLPEAFVSSPPPGTTRVPLFAEGRHHAVPGDPPLYLSHSTFLI